MKIKIEITEEDISKGIKQNPSMCPLAHSLRRIFPKSKVKVGMNSDVQCIGYCWEIFVSGGGISILRNLDKDIVSRIKEFDLTGNMEPFEFEMEVG